MAAYEFVVLSDAVAGRGADFERWYDEVHLRHVVAMASPALDPTAPTSLWREITPVVKA